MTFQPHLLLLGLLLGGGLYLILLLEAIALLVFGDSMRPGPSPSAGQVGLAFAVLLPIYIAAGALGGLLLGVLRSARRSLFGWILSGIVVTLVVSATSSLAGRVTLALTGLNLVDSDSPRAPWPLDARQLALAAGIGTVLGVLAWRWLPGRKAESTKP